MKRIYFIILFLISSILLAGAPQVFNLDDLWFGKNNSNACKILQFGSYNSNVGPIKYCPLEQKFYFSENNSNFYRFQSYLGYTPEFQLTFSGILNRNGNTISSIITNNNINNWNTAYAESHVHSNFGILENTNYAFTTTLKSYYDAKAEVSYVNGLVSNTNGYIQLQILDILGLLDNTNSGVQDQLIALEGLINNTNSVIQGQLGSKADTSYVDGLVSNTNSVIQDQLLGLNSLINNTNSVIQGELNGKSDITYVNGLVSNTNSGIQNQLSGKQNNLNFYNLSGTSNQIILSGNGLGTLINNNITLSLPQNIDINANVSFATASLNQNGTPAAITPILNLYTRANAASMAGTGSSVVWYQTPFNNNASVEMGEINFSTVGNWTGAVGTQATDFRIRRTGAGVMQDIIHEDATSIRFPNVYLMSLGGTDSSSFPYASMHIYSVSKAAAQTYPNSTPGGFLLNSYYATGEGYARYGDIVSVAGTSTNENYAGGKIRFFIQPRITSADSYNIMTLDYNKVATIYGSLNVNGTLILDSLNGLLKGTTGTVSVASGGVDYENPLTFSSPLSRSVNAVSCNNVNATQSGCLDNDNFITFSNKASTAYVDNANDNMRLYIINVNNNMKVYVDNGLSAKQNTIGYTPENIGNKNTSVTLGTSNDYYPSQGAVKSYVDTGLGTKQNTIGYTPEDVANKNTVITLGTSDTAYPTQNAVKSYVDTGLSGKQATLGYTAENSANRNTGVNLGISDTDYPSQNAVKQYVDNTNSAMKLYVDGGTFANVSLSNLSDTNINKALVPNANKTLDIGSEAKAWNNGFINNINATQIYSPTVVSENSKNFFINGAMDFFQRSGIGNANTALTTSSAYQSADMWRIWYDGTVTGAVSVISSTTVPLNQLSKYSVNVGLRRNSSGANINYEQRIEGAFARELLTSSNFSTGFMVYTPIANVTPTITVMIPSAENNYGTTATVYSNTQSAIPATTWTQVKWEGISTNSNMMNGVAVRLSLNIPSGTDGAAQVYYMTQAQLNKGNYLAPFSRNGRNIAEELLGCQRRFKKSYQIETPVQLSVGTEVGINTTWCVENSGNGGISVIWSPKMMCVPTIHTYTDAGLVDTIQRTLNGSAFLDQSTVGTIINSGDDAFYVYTTGQTAGQCGIYRFHYTAACDL